jgi:hypothetical protein
MRYECKRFFFLKELRMTDFKNPASGHSTPDVCGGLCGPETKQAGEAALLLAARHEAA